MVQLFETKYRILPVYAKNEPAGFVVYYRLWWFPFTWFAAMMDKWVTREKDGKEEGRLELNHSYAFFKTEKEAVNYINHRRTNINANETLRVQKEGKGNANEPQKG